jgi:hypothetical protein
MSTKVSQISRARVRGQIVQPGDPAYDEARAVHNGMIDRHPALLVRCADPEDVRTAVAIASELAVPLAIRGGGHSGPGFGTCDGGVVADLGALRDVTVDPSHGTVSVGGGATWADVDRATAPHGLSVPTGIISSTGVGGLTLGGGHGYLVRKYGLTIDNLLSADVVLADGRMVTADATREPDLFWALRGGGGNFGAVTAFTFRAHPVSTVIGGPMLWAWQDMPAMMRFFVDRCAEFPEDLYGFFAELIVPPGPPFPEALHLSRACAIVWCSLGDAARTASWLEPFRRHRAPIVDFVGPLAMPAINSMFDGLYPKGTRSYWKGDFFDRVTDDAIGLHEKYGRDVPTVQSTMHMYPVDGAAARVPADKTAWAHRGTRFSQIILGADAKPDSDARVTRWARDYWLALHPHSAGAGYVNFLMGDEEHERVPRTYGPNYERLSRVKAQYDPGNLFRVNHNITPA